MNGLLKKIIHDVRARKIFTSKGHEQCALCEEKLSLRHAATHHANHKVDFVKLLNPQDAEEAQQAAVFWAERILTLSHNEWLKQIARKSLRWKPQFKHKQLYQPKDPVPVALPSRCVQILPGTHIPCVEVWTDGACTNNADPGRRVSGIGVYFGPGDPRNVSRKAPPPHTNNRAELLAIITALNACPDMIDMIVNSDSQYVIGPMQDGRFGKWAEDDFEGRCNVDLWRALRDAKQRKRHIKWNWVRGHDVNIGNIEADRLAVLGATGA